MDEIYEEDSFYFRDSGSQELRPISMKKKSLIAAFPNDAVRIQEYFANIITTPTFRTRVKLGYFTY